MKNEGFIQDAGTLTRLCSPPLPPEKLEAQFSEIEEKSREILKQVQNVKGAVL